MAFLYRAPARRRSSMIEKILESLPKEKNEVGATDTGAIKFTDLYAAFPDIEILGEGSVAVVFKKDGCILDFAFLEWYTSNDKNVWFKLFWHGHGTLDPLRECRHSYIGEGGYVFYIKRKNFNLAFEWLSRHFDLDLG
jgi:hypothetical protein